MTSYNSATIKIDYESSSIFTKLSPKNLVVANNVTAQGEAFDVFPSALFNNRSQSLTNSLQVTCVTE